MIDYTFINEKINKKNMWLLSYYSPACLEGNLVHALQGMNDSKTKDKNLCKQYVLNRLQTIQNFIENSKTLTKRIKQSKEDFENLKRIFKEVFDEEPKMKDSKNYIINI